MSCPACNCELYFMCAVHNCDCNDVQCFECRTNYTRSSQAKRNTYTPTTEEVTPSTSYLRLAYHSYRSSRVGLEEVDAEFDRWLAEVKAQAWEEGMYAGKADDYFGKPDNPYRQGEQE